MSIGVEETHASTALRTRHRKECMRIHSGFYIRTTLEASEALKHAVALGCVLSTEDVLSSAGGRCVSGWRW